MTPVNVVTTNDEAFIQSGTNVIVNGGDVTLPANSTTTNTVKAIPAKSGGIVNVGVSASVAVNVANDTTHAEIQANAHLANAHNLTLIPSR